jgi:hypothetical protein
MKMLKTIMLFYCLSLGAQAQTVAQPQTRLQKLSRALQIKNASAEDLQKIATLKNEEEIQSFLRAKSAEYMKSFAFRKKMQYKIEELFRMKASSSEIPSENTQNFFDFLPKSSFDLLIQELIEQNKTWDHLLLAHNYKVKKYSNGGFGQEENHYFENMLMQPKTPVADIREVLNKLSRDLISNPNQNNYNSDKYEIFSYQFDEQDSRIAGVLATPRFFMRYGNTALNKNRRRAAAIYRIFLCDSMVPTVPSASAELDKQDLDFLNDRELTEEQIRAHGKTDLHGEQPDCRKCHDKLDPVGRVFSSSNFALGPAVAKGSLYIPRSGGTPLKKNVEGPRGLAKEIVQTPEYLRCQTEHFWRWFVGEDVPLLENQHQTLVKEFENVGRRPQEFISYLVSLPQFNQAPRALTENQILARRAVKILKTCHSCHIQNSDDMTVYWDVTDFPYGANEESRQWALDSLKDVLDHKNGGEKPTMPPKSSQWRPTRSEYDLLRTWIDRGAPDLEGRPQVGVK